MERFFGLFKHEWTNHEEYAHPEQSVFKYVETFLIPCGSTKRSAANPQPERSPSRRSKRRNNPPRRYPKALGYRSGGIVNHPSLRQPLFHQLPNCMGC
jgi:hypothetical protein